jgi:hypothetical protein
LGRSPKRKTTPSVFGGGWRKLWLVAVAVGAWTGCENQPLIVDRSLRDASERELGIPDAIVEGDLPASCVDFAPCGGDVQGTWVFTDACYGYVHPPANTLQEPCNSASFPESTSASIVGKAVFNSDGTFSLMSSLTTHITRAFDVSCTVYATCTDYENGSASSSNVTIHCGGTNQCVCEEASSASGKTMGTYVLDGNELVLTHSAPGSVTRMGFCVHGNSAHFLVGVPGRVPSARGALGVRP